MAYRLPASLDPAKITPLEPRAICRAFGTPMANTLMQNPGGSLILSRGNVVVLRAAKMQRPTMKITRAARMSRTIGLLLSSTQFFRNHMRDSILNRKTEKGGTEWLLKAFTNCLKI